MEIINPDERQFELLFAALVDVYDSAYREGPQQLYRSEYGTAQYLRWLYRGDPAGFLVALEDGQPIAFVALHGRWRERGGRVVAELHEVAVRAEWQGQGIGRSLVGLVEEQARQRGREVVTLWVGETNRPAADLYRKLGFQETRRHGVWVRMEKCLTSAE